MLLKIKIVLRKLKAIESKTVSVRITDFQFGSMVGFDCRVFLSPFVIRFQTSSLCLFDRHPQV